MSFSQQKKVALAKQDKSKKASIDNPIRTVITSINAHPEYYTTSSCSGRTVVVNRNPNKKGTTWLFVSHTQVNSVHLDFGSHRTVWFLYEPPIIHVCCSSFQYGMALVTTAQQSGFKHSGIISSTPSKTMVEIRGNERIETPLVVDNQDLKIPLQPLITLANTKMNHSHQLLKKLEKSIVSLQ